jgi:hypothetical protein
VPFFLNNDDDYDDYQGIWSCPPPKALSDEIWGSREDASPTDNKRYFSEKLKKDCMSLEFVLYLQHDTVDSSVKLHKVMNASETSLSLLNQSQSVPMMGDNQSLRATRF